MDFTFSIGLGGLALLAVGALAIGVAALYVSDSVTGIEAVVTAVGAFIGGLFASEVIVAWRDWQPVVDGLAIIPAFIGAIVVGLVTAVTVRVVTDGFGQTAAS